MKTIDVLGKPCPIPVIEAKKALAQHDVDSVLVNVDNITAAANLEKMAKGYGYGYSMTEKAKDIFEIMISKNGKSPPEQQSKADEPKDQAPQNGSMQAGMVVVIGRDTMGEGAEELGKILIKGFIYSLTALSEPPASVLFLNSGARLTSEGANTVEDIKRLEQQGTEILTCGTCVNYYGLQDSLAVGAITDMYGITEKMASAGTVINI